MFVNKKTNICCINYFKKKSIKKKNFEDLRMLKKIMKWMMDTFENKEINVIYYNLINILSIYQLNKKFYHTHLSFIYI